ncbi:MAG: DUF362 domain-containing protein [Verrucomicrobiales bacterium]|jgi:hypothetical protein|nr:DUF362 domain-containing protein [Verrucomicrobiales bacterium]
MKHLLVILCLTVSAAAQNAGMRPAVSAAPVKSRVVVLENPAIINNFRVNDTLLADSFNRALLALANQAAVSDAWRQFVTPRDVVAIHITTTGGQVLSTHRALLDAVISGLQAAGVAKRNITVWDKFASDLQAAGYNANAFRCQAVIPGAGFTPDQFYFSEIAGQLIWGDHDFRGKTKPDDFLAPDTLEISATATKPAEPPQVSNRSYYTTLLTKRATKIINLPVMSSDERIGLAGCVSSLALASVDNTRRFLNSSSTAAEAIAEIYASDIIKPKTVLHIMDGTLAQYAGGPYFIPNYCAQPGLLYLSRDPVAIDTLALERIEAWRKTKAIDPVGKDAAHLRQAAQLGIGANEKSQMEIINLR